MDDSDLPLRATLAVARKIVAYLLAVERRQQDFVPTEEFASMAGEKGCGHGWNLEENEASHKAQHEQRGHTRNYTHR
jgi:hypothetical protein